MEAKESEGIPATDPCNIVGTAWRAQRCAVRSHGGKTRCCISSSCGLSTRCLSHLSRCRSESRCGPDASTKNDKYIHTDCKAPLNFDPGALSRTERIEFAKPGPFVDDLQRPALAVRRCPAPFVLCFPHFRRTVVDFSSPLFTRWPSREHR